MSKKLIKNALIGFAVAFVAGFALSFLDTVSGSSSGSGPSLVLPAVLGILTFFMLQMLSGNRKEARVDDAARQAALSATVPPGQALLFVYREGFVGKAVGWNVTLDGTALAQLKSPRFACTAIGPGSHKLTVGLGVGGFAGTQNKPTETAFNAQAGEVVIYAMKTKMGALSSTLYFDREADPRAILQKLAKVPMVATERPGATLAA
jgi:hypothetical protein